MWQALVLAWAESHGSTMMDKIVSGFFVDPRLTDAPRSSGLLAFCLLNSVNTGVWTDGSIAGTIGYADKLEEITYTFEVRVWGVSLGC